MAIYLMRKFSLTFCILALVAFTAGCGMDQSSVASGSEEEGTALELEGKTYLTLSFGTLEPAGKEVVIKKGKKKTVSMKIDLDGGKLEVEEDERGNEDGLKVEFKVPASALKKTVDITMTVYYGETLGDLVIEFAPSGLVFEKPAMLKVEIGAKRVDIPFEIVSAVHRYGDGSSEIVPLKIDEKGNITIEIPGFSRYSLRSR